MICLLLLDLETALSSRTGFDWLITLFFFYFDCFVAFLALLDLSGFSLLGLGRLRLVISLAVEHQKLNQPTPYGAVW